MNAAFHDSECLLDSFVVYIMYDSVLINLYSQLSYLFISIRLC